MIHPFFQSNEIRVIGEASCLSATETFGQKNQRLPQPKLEKWMNPLHRQACLLLQNLLTPHESDLPSPDERGLIVLIDDTERGKTEISQAFAPNDGEPWKRVPPLWILNTLPNTTAGHLAIQFQFQGPVFTFAGKASDHLEAASGMATRWLLSDRCSMVILISIDNSLETHCTLLEKQSS
ncbi:MAG: hypothetical protein AAFY98_10420 [Verrucomicrobiota bacterium]